MHLEKKLYQSNEHSHIDVDQDKFGGLIIITTLVHGESMGATDDKYK
jgi:hypothetical protein